MAAGDVPPGWTQLDDEPFFYIALDAPEKEGEDLRFNTPVSVFLVHVKTGEGSAIGALWNSEPLTVLRRIEAFGLSDDEHVQVIVLRPNGELPVNYRFLRSVVAKMPGGSSMFVIVHYKDQRDSPEQAY